MMDGKVARRGLRRYAGVFGTFAHNSLVREMSFRANFIIEIISALSWMSMYLGFYILIFEFTPSIGAGADAWGKYEFFIFLGTTLFINSIVEAFFMPNTEELSELIRTGGLDFALLKPIDTQFLVSLQRVDWSSLANFLFAFTLVCYSFVQLGYAPSLGQILLYVVYMGCGVGILYSLMITLSATSIWLGRNQTLYDFWFYITNFSRYPMEIYSGRFGTPMRTAFTFILPVLLVVNVPANLIVRPLDRQNWSLAAYAVFAMGICLLASRWVFQRALLSYRSASS
jgi:ABC-2 type transport system permease protein